MEDDGSTPWNWGDGKTYCETIGTGYYSINSAAKQTSIESVASANSVVIKAWSGLQYDGSNWVWTDGAQDNGYTNWLVEDLSPSRSSRVSVRFDKPFQDFGKWREFRKENVLGALICGNELPTTCHAYDAIQDPLATLTERHDNLERMAVFQTEIETLLTSHPAVLSSVFPYSLKKGGWQKTFSSFSLIFFAVKNSPLHIVTDGFAALNEKLAKLDAILNILG